MFNITQHNNNNFFCYKKRTHNLFSQHEKDHINNNNYKIIRNYNQYNIPQTTQVRRAVDAILFSLGGRTQYGYIQPQRPQRILLHGKLEGQNGGLLAPLKNKF